MFGKKCKCGSRRYVPRVPGILSSGYVCIICHEPMPNKKRGGLNESNCNVDGKNQEVAT
jgi:hypothetical protein